MTIRHFQRLGRQAMLGSGSLAGLLLGWTGAGTLSAQPMNQSGPQPAAVQSAAAVQRNYLNKRVIQLPIQIADSARSSIKEVKLYSKEHPAAPWKLRDTVAPTQKAFTFQAPADGEYWFTMVTVDKQGKSYPSDLRNEPAGLAVIIDTQAPTVELTNLGTSPEGQMIQIEATDSNIDPNRLRCTFQAGDKLYRPLEMVPGRTNVYCIPAQVVTTGMIQVVAEDMAGNQTTRQEHVKNLKAATQPEASKTQTVVNAQPLLPIPEVTPMKQPAPVVPNTLPANVIGTAPAITPVETHQVQRTAPERSSMPRPNGSEGPHWSEEKPTEPVKTEPVKTEPEQPLITNGSGLVQTSNSAAKPGSGPALLQTATAAKHTSLKRQFVNNTKVFLDYQIENASQASVARVEIWLTRDQGQSWQKHGDVTGAKNPIEVQLPGDGVYGLTLVASNGANGAAPPVAGDQPDGLIEVDTTKPTLEINDIQTTFDKGQATVQIRWTAQDKNLADGPVELQYAATPQGKWLPIAKGLPASGQHRWTPPAGIGAQMHLQLVVRDAAGNSAVCGTSEPVSLAPPRAVIRTISVGAPIATQP